MANLDSTGVTVNEVWTEGGTNGRRVTCMDVSLVVTGQGGTTNLIPASAFGLNYITQCSNFVVSTDASIYVGCPNNARTAVLLANLAQATDANRDDPADVTSVTLRGTIKGY